MHDVKADRGGQPDRLGQPSLGGPVGFEPVGLLPGEDDRGAGGRRVSLITQWLGYPPAGVSRVPRVSVVGLSGAAVVSTFGPSNSEIGAPGMTVLIACL